MFFLVFITFLPLLELRLGGFGSLPGLVIEVPASPIFPAIIGRFVKTLLDGFPLVGLVALGLPVLLVVIGAIDELLGFEFLKWQKEYLLEAVHLVCLPILFDQIVQRNISHPLHSI